MKQFFIALLSFVFLSFKPAAEPDQPRKTINAAKPLSYHAGEIISQVRIAKDYYMTSNAPDAGNTYEQRFSNLRNKVSSIFGEFSSHRKNEYGKVEFEFYKTDWCTNGNRGCSSSRTLTLAKAYKMLPETVKHTTNGDFKKGPVINEKENTITWKTGTHGKHAETFLSINAKYTDTYIDNIVKTEVSNLKVQLNTLGLPTGDFE